MALTHQSKYRNVDLFSQPLCCFLLVCHPLLSLPERVLRVRLRELRRVFPRCELPGLRCRKLRLQVPFFQRTSWHHLPHSGAGTPTSSLSLDFTSWTYPTPSFAWFKREIGNLCFLFWSIDLLHIYLFNLCVVVVSKLAILEERNQSSVLKWQFRELRSRLC